MIIKIIIFKGMVLDITMECPKIKDHNKHKTPLKRIFLLNTDDRFRNRGMKSLESGN